jgi:hypothetical protein
MIACERNITAVGRAARDQACLGVQYFDAADFAQRIADSP